MFAYWDQLLCWNGTNCPEASVVLLLVSVISLDAQCMMGKGCFPDSFQQNCSNDSWRPK